MRKFKVILVFSLVFVVGYSILLHLTTFTPLHLENFANCNLRHSTLWKEIIGNYSHIIVTRNNSLAGHVPIPKVRNSIAMQRNVIELLLEDFTRVYLDKMRKLALSQLSGDCPIRIIVYECSDFQASCGGLVDRLRGLVSAFYAAYVSNRLLVINWLTPDDLGKFFAINEEMYDIKLPEHNKGLLATLLKGEAFELKNRNYDPWRPNGLDLTYLSSSEPVLTCTENDLKSMEGYFNLSEMDELSTVIEMHTNNIMPISFELATFLALRVLLRHPKPVLRDAVADFSFRLEQLRGNNETLKERGDNCIIGVHVRTTPKDLFRRFPDGPRITRKQFEKCLIQKIANISSDSGCPRGCVVYVASDASEAKQWLVDTLWSQFGIKAIKSDYEPLHIDNDMTKSDPSERYRSMFETLVDWMVLATEASHLVITRSGFGEMASTYGSFMAYRIGATHRLLFSARDECNFQYDYHIADARLENYKQD